MWLFKKEITMYGITEKNFDEAIKRIKPNPFFDKLCKRVEVTVDNESYDIYAKIAEENGVRPEDVMFRALTAYAKELDEFD
jgi:hypothetical protein